MRSLSCLPLLALLAGCGASPVQQVGFTFDLNRQAAGAVGTSPSDLWNFTVDGKTAQDDPFDLHVQYWDGTKAIDVPFGDTFREGACGKPASMAAVTKGEVWLGSFRVANCGFGTNSNDRLIFGKLKKDGTWEDHSSDFPISAPGTYKMIDLFGRGGVLYVSVTYNTAGPSTYKLFRYAADGTHSELTLPMNFSAGAVVALGPDELLHTATPTSRLKNGTWTSIPDLKFNVGTNHVNTGGERWSFGPIIDRVVPVVYRYDGETFTEVTLTFAKSDDDIGVAAGFVPLDIIPRGGGKMTFLLVQRAAKVGGLTVVAREWDGARLSEARTLTTAGTCKGTDQQCLARDARVRLLEDGSALVTHDGSLWFYTVDPRAVP